MRERLPSAKSCANEWTAALDLIVWLDAPNELLLGRVLARDEWHEAKERSQRVNLQSFTRYRSGYGRIIAAMSAQGAPRVLRFHTDQIATVQMADRVLAVMNQKGELSQDE